jgi:hypothetical protein
VAWSFLFCLLITHEARGTLCDTCGPALTQMFDGVVLVFPDKNITIDGNEISFHDFHCYNLSIGFVDVNPTVDDVNFILGGVQITCFSEYNGTLPGSMSTDSNGTLFIDIEDVDLNGTISWKRDNSGVPESVSLDQCSAIVMFNVTVTGSSVTSLSDSLVPYAQTYLNAVICTELTALIGGRGTDLLEAYFLPSMHNLMSINATLSPAPQPFYDGMFPISQYNWLWGILSRTLGSYGTNNQLFINNVINYLTNNTGVYTFHNISLPLSFPDVGFAVSLMVENVSLIGLNTFESFKVFDIVNDSNYDSTYSLSFEVSIQEIQLNASALLTVKPGQLFQFGNAQTSQLNVSAGALGVVAKSTVHVEFNETDYVTVKTSAQKSNSPMGCLLADVRRYNITLLDVSFDDLIFPSVDSAFGLAPLFNEDMAFLKDFLGPITPAVLHGSLSTSIREAINTVINRTLVNIFINSDTFCPHVQSSNLTNQFVPVNLMTDPTISNYRKASNLVSLNSPLYFSINQILEGVPETLNQPILLPFVLVRWNSSNLSALGFNQFELTIANLSLTNMDSFSRLDLFQTSSPDTINFDFAFGGPSNHEHPTFAAVDFEMKLSGPAILSNGGIWSSRFQFGIEITNYTSSVNFTLDMVAYILENGDTAGLSIQGIQKLTIDNLLSTIRGARLNVSCYQCGPRGFAEWVQQLRSSEAFLSFTSDVQLFLQYFGSSGALALMNNLIQANLPSTRQSFQSQPAFSTKSQVFVTSVLLVVFLMVYFLFIGYKYFVQIRSKKNLPEIQKMSKIQPLMQSKGKGDPVEERRTTTDFEMDLPLYQNSRVSKRLKAIVPVSIALSTALFVYSHVVAGSSVTFSGLFAGEPISTLPIMSLSPVDTFSHLANGGQFIAAIVLLIFVILWPYSRSLLLVCCWFYSSKQWNQEIRSKSLLFSHMFGKWALIEVFMLVCFIVVFHIQIESLQGKSYLPNDIFSLGVVIVPSWAVFGFILGLVMQLAVNQIILHCTQEVMNHIEGEESSLLIEKIHQFEFVEENDDSKAPPSASSYAKLVLRDYDIDEEIAHIEKDRSVEVLVQLSTRGRRIMTILLALSYVLLIIGVLVPLFTVEFSGIAANFMVSSTIKTTYSFTSIFSQMAQPQIGFAALAFGFILFCFIGPISLLFLLSYLWMYPVHPKFSRYIRLALHILRPFFGVDVFVISILIFVADAQMVSQTLGTTYCGINTYYPSADRNGDLCYGLNVSVENASLLFGWAVMHLTITFALLSEISTGAFLNSDMHEKSDIVLQEAKIVLPYSSRRYSYLTSFGVVTPVPKEKLKDHLTKGESIRIALQILEYRQSLRESLQPVMISVTKDKKKKKKHALLAQPSVEMYSTQNIIPVYQEIDPSDHMDVVDEEAEDSRSRATDTEMTLNDSRFSAFSQ